MGPRCIESLQIEPRPADHVVVGDQDAPHRAQQRGIGDQPFENVSRRIGDQLPGLDQDSQHAGDQTTVRNEIRRGQRCAKSFAGLTTLAAMLVASVARQSETIAIESTQGSRNRDSTSTGSQIDSP